MLDNHKTGIFYPVESCLFDYRVADGIFDGEPISYLEFMSKKILSDDISSKTTDSFDRVVVWSGSG